MINLSGLYHAWKKTHKKNATRKEYLNLYKKIFALHPELRQQEPGETEWLNKWKRYDSNVSVSSYRIFSKFIGNDQNIIPLEVCANSVEPVLNPQEYMEFYADKNSLHFYLPAHFLPHVYIRNINGYFYDEAYKALTIEQVKVILHSVEQDKLIIKPSRECSGQGVQLVRKENGSFIDRDNQTIDLDYLDSHYHKDYVIQECITQCDYLAQFNPTSVNTIRIFTYRDNNGVIHPMRAILRIGGKGANVDNAHAGGMFCGIDENGKLGKFCCSWLADRVSVFNEHDFEKNIYTILDYERVKQFSISVAERIPYHDLVALDVTLDQTLTPKLLEINVGGFSAWLFQFTVGSAFGEFTDEIMQRCK